MASTKIIHLYKGLLSNWPKMAGRKVTEADLLNAAIACKSINKTPGGVEFMAVAMYFRAGYGATTGQVQAACKSGAACNLHGLLKNAHAAVAVNLPPRVDIKGERVHKVYALALSKPVTKVVKAVTKVVKAAPVVETTSVTPATPPSTK